MSLSERKFKAIYRYLDMVSPLEGDCGKLCGAACCTTKGDEEMGIYLLPGEESLHREELDSYEKQMCEETRGTNDKQKFIPCKNPPHCNRSMRPIQCRTFPLLPHITGEGDLMLVYNDIELPYKCPIIEDEMEIDQEFILATYTAWLHLIEDPDIYDIVKKDSLERDESFAELAEKLGR